MEGILRFLMGSPLPPIHSLFSRHTTMPRTNSRKRHSRDIDTQTPLWRHGLCHLFRNFRNCRNSWQRYETSRTESGRSACILSCSKCTQKFLHAPSMNSGVGWNRSISQLIHFYLQRICNRTTVIFDASQPTIDWHTAETITIRWETTPTTIRWDDWLCYCFVIGTEEGIQNYTFLPVFTRENNSLIF